MCTAQRSYNMDRPSILAEIDRELQLLSTSLSLYIHSCCGVEAGEEGEAAVKSFEAWLYDYTDEEPPNKLVVHPLLRVAVSYFHDGVFNIAKWLIMSDPSKNDDDAPHSLSEYTKDSLPATYGDIYFIFLMHMAVMYLRKAYQQTKPFVKTVGNKVIIDTYGIGNVSLNFSTPMAIPTVPKP